MSVIASCGHELQEDEGDDGMGWTLATADWGREGRPSVRYGVYCTKCRDRRVADGSALPTEHHEMEWLTSEHPTYGDWLVFEERYGPNSVEKECVPWGKYRGHVDAIALKLDTREETVLTFAPNPDQDGISVADKEPVRDFAAIRVKGEGSYWYDLPDGSSKFAGRPVAVSRAQEELCHIVYSRESDWGKEMASRLDALQAVLKKLSAEDIEVLREHGLKV